MRAFCLHSKKNINHRSSLRRIEAGIILKCLYGIHQNEQRWSCVRTKVDRERFSIYFGRLAVAGNGLDIAE